MAMSTGTATMEVSVKDPKKQRELQHDPAVPLEGTWLKETVQHGDTFTHAFVDAVFTKAKRWNRYKCPSTCEWVKKKNWYVYKMDFHSAEEKLNS